MAAPVYSLGIAGLAVKQEGGIVTRTWPVAKGPLASARLIPLHPLADRSGPSRSSASTYSYYAVYLLSMLVLVGKQRWQTAPDWTSIRRRTPCHVKHGLVGVLFWLRDLLRLSKGGRSVGLGGPRRGRLRRRNGLQEGFNMVRGTIHSK